MKQKIQHRSAKSNHYDQEVGQYDVFNEENSRVINQTIESILKDEAFTNVLDLSCGTGSQVFWLAEKGYQVTGVDINEKMLVIAKEKARKKSANVSLETGDMRTANLGKFDAVITIFNAIGHLTKKDFYKTLKNIHSQLNPGGIYIFDIFNLAYLLDKDNITKLTIDRQNKNEGWTVREIQYSTIDKSGLLASYDIYHEQQNDSSPKITTAFQTLQVYTAEDLKKMLDESGFTVSKLCNVDGSSFKETKSERMLIVGKKP